MSLNPIIRSTFDFAEPIVTQIQVADAQNKLTVLVTSSEFGKIKNLTGYLDREGFFGMIATVLHRIWNACKAVFGQSDWQQAEKAMISIIDRLTPLASQLGVSALEVCGAKALIGDLFELAIERINGGNKIARASQAEEIIEKGLVPYVNQIFTNIDKDATINNFCHEASRFVALYEQMKNSKDDKNFKADEAVYDAISKTGFINHQGIDLIKNMRSNLDKIEKTL